MKEYKEIIKNVKERLMNNDYEDSRRINKCGYGECRYKLNSKTLSPSEMKELCEKVMAMTDTDEVFALGKLADNEVLASLAQDEQERYLMELARLYRGLKDKIKNGEV